jgi:hypothetical protein
MSFIDMLDDAMHEGTKLIIITKERGKYIGVPHNVDEFEADEERLGYVVDVGGDIFAIIFLDEIVEITTSPISRPEGFIQFTAKLVSGE